MYDIIMTIKMKRKKKKIVKNIHFNFKIKEHLQHCTCIKWNIQKYSPASKMIFFIKWLVKTVHFTLAAETKHDKTLQC